MYWLKFRAEKVRVLKKPIAANYVFVIKDLMITCQCITEMAEIKQIFLIWKQDISYAFGQ